MANDAFSDDVRALLHDVEHATGHGALFMEPANPGNRQTGTAFCAFCRYCIDRAPAAALCRENYRNATQQSLASGEPFFYSCWAGLLFVAVAIAPQQEGRGCIAVGGFCPAGEKGNLRAALASRLQRTEGIDLPALFTRLSSLPTITPSVLRGIGLFVLEATFTSGLNSSRFFQIQRAKYVQQRAIAEACSAIPPDMRTPEALLTQAYALVTRAELDPLELTRRRATVYLAGLLLDGQWDLVRFKAHLRVLLALLTRHAVLQAGDWAAASSAEMRFLTRLDQARTVADTCHLVMELLPVQRPVGAGYRTPGSPLADRVTRWLQAHFREEARLAVASRAIGASVPTIVLHLRNERGKTFHQLLTEIRISEAKRLLATTTHEVSEIAALCGFFDQSHFTKALRKAINLTPGQFRRLLRIPPEEV